MRIIAKFVVFYRDMPVILETTLNQDVRTSFIKDGVKDFSDGHKSPRLTIVLAESEFKSDRDRIDTLSALLENLEKNNQIVGFRRAS